jgi:hypothetical protein
VKRSLFTLALATLAVAAALPASALDTNGIGEFNVEHSPFNLAEAYPCAIGTYAANSGIYDLQLFKGINQGDCTNVPLTTGAAPGILSLKRPKADSFFLDVNCFATIPEGQTGPCFVQAYRLFKEVPGSFKCPDVYGTPHFDKDGNLIPYRYIQFGTGVRTWWSLNFTQPGTKFLLQVVSACQVPNPGPNTPNNTRTVMHADSWRWRVVADVITLRYVIDLMHSPAVSTLEVPCILGEDMYDALIAAQVKLKAAIDARDQAVTDFDKNAKLTDVANAIFDMEALIVANCLFVEVLNPLVAFPGPDQFGAPNFQPPGNLAQTVFFGSGSAVAGIIDTIENPCCCKLLVDLEWISLRNGLVGQSPTLPTF